MLKRFGTPPSRRRQSRAAVKAAAVVHRRGVEVGRVWGATGATPAEIDRVSEALHNCMESVNDPALEANPGVGGFVLLARLAFLIRPELLAGEGGDLDAAMTEAAGFWKQILGDSYQTTTFGDHTEAGSWFRGFAEGAIDGYLGLATMSIMDTVAHVRGRSDRRVSGAGVVTRRQG